ncbi:thermophilic serine proteinase precursor, putative [Perkinsus marinus ATCC 50983]|uniref:subtilisin n=1 Tax=Perkinsus marinus (strain ATCC 50983 / TXsc) TaxID=423536 RepID=C5KLH2_PERM5|nr:thermophilic serine proteinase precursor, putative [Perkinsus marinus ATCC 50983]EER14667.1 thermophilic serine proteinase precursor, putative [Perkinsus marinus ATCC 50983]|eukprot:XP_002782871.1 thermophilic serine proteinase precursor, putative [Perkinsus marinus ATCC 50983]
MKLLVTSFWFFSGNLFYVEAEVGENGYFRGLGPVNGDPNDKYYHMQKAYLEAISIPEAWSILDPIAKRRPVTIAVIDEGIDANHPDLEDTVIKGYNVVDKNYDTRPRGPHGTIMTGIVGAIRNNKIGLAGILDSVRILPIFDGEVPTFPALMDAFTYLINKRRDDVNVILMTEFSKPSSQAVIDKILEAAAAGMLVVVAAGNDQADLDINPYFPCSFDRSPTDGVLCVAATRGAEMELVSTSNFGSAVDIAAPGNEIVSTTLGEEYVQVRGTSAAAAIVAGIAGMLYSLEPSLKTKLTPAYIKSIIKDTATQGVKDSKGVETLTFGRVNAAAAVNKILGRKKV